MPFALGGQAHRSVIITMVPMRMMKVPIDEVVMVIAVRNDLVSAVRAVLVGSVMGVAPMFRRAPHWIEGAHVERMLVVMAIVQRMKMPVVKEVCVSLVRDRGVLTRG